MRLAFAGAHVYAWLFIFQYFVLMRSGDIAAALAAVALTFALTHVIAVLMTPLAARQLVHGARRSIAIAVLAAALAFAVLGGTIAGVFGALAVAVLSFAILMGVHRAFYWLPYALVGTRQGMPTEFLVALAPAAAGLSLTIPGFVPLLLAIAAVVAVLSLVPLSIVRDAHEGFSWGYRETFHELFDAARVRTFARSLLDGVEGAALLLLWPIAAFVLFGLSYATLGIVLTATFLLILLARIALRRFRAPSPAVVGALSVSAWILRLTAAGPVAVVLIDAYHHGTSSMGRGYDVPTLEQSGDSHSYLDEMTALKEMGQGIGRVLLCLLVAALAGLFSFASTIIVAFLIAAAAGASSIILARARA